MVLIGDPKQAIYAFRGGDVVTYLAAAATATTRATLDTNRRSDADLVERLQVVLRGAALGDPRIVVRDVTAAHPGSRLAGAPSPAPFRLRQVRRRGFPLARGLIRADDARRHIAADCAADIAALLASDATWDGEPIAARHVAVLVGEWSQAELVRVGSRRARHPGGGRRRHQAADLAGRRRVAVPARGARAAASVRTRAGGRAHVVPRPHPERARRAAARRSPTSSPTGCGAGRCSLRGRGVAALFEATEERGLTARVLGTVGGERLLTDLRHVAQTLHETARRESLGLTGLLEWLRSERENAPPGARTPPRQRRRRGADHDGPPEQGPAVPRRAPALRLDELRPVGRRRPLPRRATAPGCSTSPAAGATWAAHEQAHLREEAGEELRDLYVALTRAQSQVVTWWAPTAQHPARRPPPAAVRAPAGAGRRARQPGVKDDDYAAQDPRAARRARRARRPRCRWSRPRHPRPQRRSAPATLAARVFDREVDTEWRRTSYSGLIRVQEQPAGVTSEPEVEPTGIRRSRSPVVAARPKRACSRGRLTRARAGPAVARWPPCRPARPSAAWSTACSRRATPRHPTCAPSWPRTPASSCQWWPVGVEADELADAPAARRSSRRSAPLASGLRLVDIPLRDRLCELDFEFPLTGGDRPETARPDVQPARRGAAAGRPPARRRPARVVRRTARRARSATSPCAATSPGRSTWCCGCPAIRPTARPPLRRRRLQDQPARGDRGRRSPRPTTATPRWRPRCCTATTRSRRCSTPSSCTATCAGGCRRTTPEQHLGGVLYLFLRGMCGPETPVVDGHVAGVFDWSPPAALVTDLSDLLEGVAMIEPFETDDPHDRRFALGLTGVLGRFNAAGRHRGRRRPHGPPDPGARRRARRRGRARARADGAVAAPRVGVPRPRRPRRRGRCPAGWPGRAPAGSTGSRASRLAEAGVLRVEGSVAYLDRYWREECQVRDDLVARLAAAAAGGRRRTPRGAGAGALPAGVRRAARRRAWRRPGSGPPCSPAARAPARRPRSPVCSPCSPTSPTGRSGSRSPLRPARPRPGCRRRSARRWPSRAFADHADRGRSTRRPRRCTGSWAGSAAAATGSATTAATGCRTT